MKNKLNILITGSGGYISSHILKSKIIKRHNVKLVYRKNKPKFNLDNFELFKIDLTKKKNLINLNVFDIDIIIHLAGYVNPRRNNIFKKKSNNENFLTTKNIVEIAKKNKNIKFIFLSSDKVYSQKSKYPLITEKPKPSMFYGKMKYKCEQIIKSNIKRHIILRVPIVHSNSLKLIKSSPFIDRAIQQKKHIKAYGNIVRSFIDADLLSLLILNLMTRNYYGVFNVGSKPYSYFERLIFLNLRYNKKIKISSIKGDITPLIQAPIPSYRLLKDKSLMKCFI